MNTTLFADIETSDQNVTRDISNVFWISDLILTNPRDERREDDVLSTLTVWGGIIETSALLALHAFSFIFNIFFLVLLFNRRRARKIMKLRIMLTAMCISNIIFNVTWFFCIAVNYLISLEESGTLLDDVDKEFGDIVWEIAGHQCVDSLLAIQSIYLLSLSMDRYLNLFSEYSPYVKGHCESILIWTVPTLLGVLLFDHRWIALLVPYSSAVFSRLCGLLLPHLLSFVLLLVVSLRPPPTFEYEPRLASSLAKSLPIVLFCIVTVDLFARVGMFFELLQENFNFVIIIGSQRADEILSLTLRGWFHVSHVLLHAFPLYSTLSLLIFVRHYRQLSVRALPVMCCQTLRTEKLDYASETMRSMMAEQRRQRIMTSSMH